MAISLWKGTSLLDRSTEIEVLGTGHRDPSTNEKTGPMLQTMILLANTHPVEALRSGADVAICGDCVHKEGENDCYVNWGKGPASAWKAEREQPVAPRRWARRRKVRVGAAGDPAAVPFLFWEELLSDSAGWTGYTQQWATCDQRLKRFCMASVHSLEQIDQAHDLGWRVFYTGPDRESMPNNARTTLCPASAEAGKRLTCEQCMHCNGLGMDMRVGDVYTPVHGAQWKVMRFLKKVA
jgi:hypothetical protein